MAGIAGEESGAGRSSDGNSSTQRCQSGELAEWRSSEQVENGTPSTSPPYWDTDDDDDGGLKPSELYGKYTWKIEKFSQLNKRELRSNAFEVGGYKWYILIYPQGCDVCNHLSLFLCVANHDKLLPGWSHFAQFTIAVVNKDPKKSKYSDTLHRFWKKEHDWGWKKFMELSKVLDGFIDSDTLIIKAQVQVIREKAERPFRCLDCQYRRELVRVYLTNVEQICRRFMEERRSKLGKLIDDKTRWSSFCSFWLGIDQNSRRRMSREKTDSILKVVVKNFFIEKEVTSTLVMDSLYSGLKALEGQTKSKKAKVKLLEAEEMPAPIIRVEKDTFVLVDDVLLLLERAAMEPLPPKDEKGPQNRTKDGNSGEDFNKDSIERDERKLTELGRRTVEIFVLAHIFSNKIEVAYQEAVALKRQEELIREEEAAWLVESELKAKRSEKEKKSKKKQSKQKRNNRKGKDKGRDKHIGNPSEEGKDSLTPVEKPDVLEDISDVSDSVDGVVDTQPDSEDRDTDTSEVQPSIETISKGLSSAQNGLSDKKSLSLMDDSSSTCSTDSVPSVVMNGPYKGNNFATSKPQKSPSRGKNRGVALSGGSNWANESDSQSSIAVTEACESNDVSKTGDSESEAMVTSLQDRIQWLELHVVKKEEEVVTLQKKLCVKDQVETEKPTKDKASAPTRTSTPTPTPTPSSNSPSKTTPLTGQPKPEAPSTASSDATQVKKPTLNSHQPIPVPTKPEPQKATTPKPTEKPQIAVISRPSSAPIVPPGPSPSPRPSAPMVSMVHSTSPLLARSMSAAGRLGPDPSPATHSFVPQSYRNAMMGNNNNNHVPASSASSPFLHAPMFMPQISSGRAEPEFPKPYNAMYGNVYYDPSPGPSADEFPHLDIINDLLDDESGAGLGPGFDPVGNGSNPLNRQFTFPGDLSAAGNGGPSTSSCRFERTRSYQEEGYNRNFGSQGGHYEPIREYIPQASPNPYVNGQIDGMVPNQWQIPSADMNLMMMRNPESEGYPFYNPDYSNMVNGYTMFRPSNGH